ncbi:hypothetical protein [Alteraurantiacibacter aquimixticola]|uniref:Uncharacterized protein n=1 Tax=Alteraurantiacibacter aquimixticola TaxID=2489173 RepID=A0A4T3F588_9SPHN|nr:hypothetical protein [Alteraurantiacibacter aquimixticola]TIX51544.1 hypothetical protein E5222_03570 [Alteraurantiacibacter aquimixticola]
MRTDTIEAENSMMICKQNIKRLLKKMNGATNPELKETLLDLLIKEEEKLGSLTAECREGPAQSSIFRF